MRSENTLRENRQQKRITVIKRPDDAVFNCDIAHPLRLFSHERGPLFVAQLHHIVSGLEPSEQKRVNVVHLLCRLLCVSAKIAFRVL